MPGLGEIVRILAVAVLFSNIYAGLGQLFHLNDFLSNFSISSPVAYGDVDDQSISERNQEDSRYIGNGEVNEAEAEQLSEIPEDLICNSSDTVLLIQDNVPWDPLNDPLGADVEELKVQQKPFCMINSDQIGVANLDQFREIILSAAQTQTFYNNLFPEGTVHPALVTWVEQGGILSALLTDCASGPGNAGTWATELCNANENTSFTFVGGVKHAQSFSSDNNIADLTHPIITGAFGSTNGGTIADSDFFNDLDGWGSSSHGFFVNLPSGTTVILDQPDVTGDGVPEPVIVQYPFGSGKVIASMTTTEWRYVGGFGSLPVNKKLLVNEIGFQDEISANKLGTITIFKKDPLGNLVSVAGAIFEIVPNPLTGSGSLIVTDNGADDDDESIGIIKVNNAKFGTYSITETQPPAGYLSPSVPTQTGVLDSSTPELQVEFIDSLSGTTTVTTENGIVKVTVTTPVIPRAAAGVAIILDVPTTPTASTVEQLITPLAIDGSDISFTIQVSTDAQAFPGVPPPPVSGQLGVLIDVDTTGTIDFSDPASFSANPTLTFLVDKNINADRIPGDPFNCPEVQAFILNEATGSWEPAVSIERDLGTDQGTDTATTADDKCEYAVTNNHLSKFSVGGVVRPASKGSGGGISGGAGFAFGDPNSSNYDSTPPTIGKVLTESGSLKVSAEILDNVAVKDSNIIVGKTAYPMKQHDGNPVWWEGIVPSSDLPGSGSSVSFKIVARDYNNNIAEYSSLAEVPAEALASQQGASLVITPAGIVGQQLDPSYSIVAAGVRPDGPNANPHITIKNTGKEPLKNIRLVLSPELRGKFLLSDYAIKSIAPKSETAVTLKLNGNPNVNAMKEPIPYDGQIIVTIDNHSPIVLKLSGNIPNDSSSLQSLFMKMVASKAEQRYRNFIPDERISQKTDYQVTLGSGESVIKSASDELIITNNGEKPLKNLRIITSSIGDQFLPDQKNIQLIPAGSFVKVKLMSKMYNAESPRDLQGELLVVPENGAPVTIPISIGKKLAEDKNAMYEVRTISGNDAISNTADGIVIKNNSEDTIDNVRIILPRELARVLSLSEDSFKSIEPNAEKIVSLQPRGTIDSKVKQMVNDYTGDMIIISSDGMKKVVPVNIVWKGISSEHFVIYARDNADELAKATQVINSLERSYPAVTGFMSDELKTKTVIYMTDSLDELKMISDALAPSIFVYDEDVVFVWSNSDVNMLTLKEFAHRTIVQNYASYWSKQKISADKGNWLVDSISNYVTARIVGERAMIKEQLDAFIAEPASFEWYGAATQSQHGASYTLFKMLVDKYGDGIIDKTLVYLGSTMISNHRCDTIEQCALLHAVYDVSGLDMDNRNYTLSFKNLLGEWEEYVKDNYSNEDTMNTVIDNSWTIHKNQFAYHIE